MKTTVICLGSYKVKDITGVDSTNIDRQTLYAVALKCLLEVMPKGTEVVVAENTITSVDEIDKILGQQLKRPEISRLVLVKNNELGAKNKGAGEYVMCQSVVQQCRSLIENSEWIIYFTSRYPLSFPFMFHYLEKYPDKDAIVSNAPVFSSDGKMWPCAPGNFYDVIFAMKSGPFLKYVGSMDPQKLTEKKMNSEQNLYNFILQNGLEYQNVDHLGIFRYDYVINDMQIM